jgi:glycosyltransferase involved in cell wall biosynthesis/pimeloyl-ACP methyl ester carboxylesterase
MKNMINDEQNGKKKINIAIICDPITDCLAGSFVSTLRFAEILKRQGHKIIFIAARSPKNRHDNYYKDMKIYRFISVYLPKSEGQFYLSFPTAGKLKKIFKKEKIDLIHIIIPSPSAIAAIRAAKYLGLKIIAHSHTQPENLFLHLPKIGLIKKLNGYFYKYLSWLYRQADFIIYPSLFAKEMFGRLNEGIPSAVISNGVDTAKYKKTDPEELFKKFNLPRTTENILFVGRLHPEKSVDTLIKSIPFIINNYRNIHIYIVGFGHLETELRNLSKNLSVSEFITFFGRVDEDDLIMAYTACDIFVLPSLAELEGMVVLEAMASGKPLVIADAENSASKYFVDDNGLLFKPEDPKNLAGQILKLLNDKTLRDRMAAASLGKSREYDINECALKLENSYYRILETEMKEYILPIKNIYYRTNEILPDRPTLIFIHGLSGSSSAWVEYEKKFAGNCNVISYDLLGHGKTVKSKKYQDYEIKNFADDLYSLIKRLDLKDFTLVSHSFGTLIALEFLVEHHDLAKSVVFLSPNFAITRRRSARVIKPLLMLSKIFDLLPFSEKAGGHIDYRKYINTGDWNLRRTIADVSNTCLRPYFYSTRQSYNFNRENFLSEIKIPVLIMHGKKDTIFPIDNSLIMKEKIKNSELILLDNTDHILVLNNFKEVSEAIEKFIKKNKEL